MVRIIKMQLDQYLKHSSAAFDIENINYNFLEKNVYDKNKDPFQVIEDDEIMNELTPAQG